MFVDDFKKMIFYDDTRADFLKYDLLLSRYTVYYSLVLGNRFYHSNDVPYCYPYFLGLFNDGFAFCQNVNQDSFTESDFFSTPLGVVRSHYSLNLASWYTYAQSSFSRPFSYDLYSSLNFNLNDYTYSNKVFIASFASFDDALLYYINNYKSLFDVVLFRSCPDERYKYKNELFHLRIPLFNNPCCVLDYSPIVQLLGGSV